MSFLLSNDTVITINQILYLIMFHVIIVCSEN